MSDERKSLPEHIFKRVEKELYRYPRYKATLAAYPVDRNDILLRFREWPPPEGGVSGQTSDRTGGGAIRLDFIDERKRAAEQIVEAIEACYATLNDEEQELVRLKYWQRNQMTNEQIIATMDMERPISRRQWYRMREDVVAEFAKVMLFDAMDESA